MHQIKVGLEQSDCIATNGPLEHSGFYRSYDDDPIKCWDVQVGDIEVKTFYSLGPSGLYRTVLLARNDVISRKIVVFVAGGPRFPTIPYNEKDLRASALYGMVINGALVITIDHLGTVSRSLYPASDVEPAAREIRDLIGRIRKITTVPVVGVVAASAGALIGIDFLRGTSDNVVLLSPPIVSIKDLMTAPAGSDIPPNPATNVRYFTTIDRRTSKLTSVKSTDGVQIPAFAGQAYTRSLASLLDDIPVGRRGCLSIVYGSADRRIIIDRIGEVDRRHPWAKLVKIDGYAHRSASQEQGAEVGAAILGQLDRLKCRPQRRSKASPAAAR